MTVLSLSVVICTWNRSDMLEDSIRSVLACEADPSFTRQLIVVDNASTDGTAALLDRLASELSFDRLFEPRAGLSNARNTGVARATGYWLIFLDDDVLLERDFLANYARAIRALPEAGFLAGGIHPQFDDPLSGWTQQLLQREAWAFSAIDLGPPMRELAPWQLPFGANMAVRRVLLADTGFSDQYGYRHGAMIPGEESALFEAIRAGGHRGFWVPDVPVQHRMPAHRRSFAYLRKRAFGQGRAECMRTREKGASRWRVPWWVPGEIVGLSMLCTWQAVRGHTDTRVTALLLTRRVGHFLQHFIG